MSTDPPATSLPSSYPVPTSLKPATPHYDLVRRFVFIDLDRATYIDLQRWVFLVFSSLSFFAIQLFIDQTSSLVGRLTGTAVACLDGTDTACLDFTATEFNSFYVAHFWAGGATAVLSGFFIGKYGVWFMSCVSAGLIFCGTLLFTLGPYVVNNVGAYGLMLTGRLIFSIGGFAQVTLSHQIKSHWFFGRELALAFALHIAASRVGAILAFASVGTLAEQYGLQQTLWITFGIALIAPIGAIIAGWIYKTYVSAAVDAAIHLDNGEAGQFGFRKVTRLQRQFWVMTGIIIFFFGPLFTIIADFPKFLSETYGYAESKAGQVTGLIPGISVCAPLFGYLVDKFGRRDLFNVVATSLFFLGVMLLAVAPQVNPVTSCVLIAVPYAIVTASIWGSIPVVTSPGVVGVAQGFAVGIQALSSGLLLLLTGVLLDQTSLLVSRRWMIFFAFMASCAGAAWLLSGLSFYYDFTDPLRPLRRKYTKPVIVVEIDSVADESTPLLPNTIRER